MQLLANILPWAQIVISVLLAASVILQKNEAGLGAAFGGSSGGSQFHTRRGLEKWLFYTTIVLAILFALSAVLTLFI